MNKLKVQFKNFKKLKLNIKFNIVIITLVVLPIAAFSLFLFANMEENVISEKRDAMEYRMERSYDQIIKNIDAINMSAQFFLGDSGLNDHLKAVRAGEEISAAELMDFYKQNITLLERMVNNNTYLYQIRVYVDSQRMQEMMPILYREERMRHLAWADGAEGEITAGWKFDYFDTLFDTAGMNREKKLMSSVMPIGGSREGKLGTLEVAMYMETMFPVIYEPEESTFGCFIDRDGNMYYREDRADNIDERNTDNENSDGNADNENAEAALAKYVNAPVIKAALAAGTEKVFYSRIDRQPMMVGILPVREMDGVLLCFNSLRAELGNVSRLRILSVFVAGFIIIALAFVINFIVKSLLHRFYDILHSIREVQKGDLEVVIADCGPDEMGELGTQINTMLKRIRQLMEDNINREVLARDSEIRALQNQINAHFIYNVLESIKMMAEIDEKYEISDAITALGKLLRYSMRWGDDYVPVAEELEYIKNYLQLINLRFDYEITLAVSIPENIRVQKIPKMSLQPIIENAIYHGIEQLAEDTSIYIKGFTEGPDFIIEITDMGRGMTEAEVERLYLKLNGGIETSGGAGNGIGLKNVQDRIKMGYGDEYGIQIHSRQGLFTKIIVRIPVNVMEPEEVPGFG